jgi:hypothetical protein
MHKIRVTQPLTLNPPLQTSRTQSLELLQHSTHRGTFPRGQLLSAFHMQLLTAARPPCSLCITSLYQQHNINL